MPLEWHVKLSFSWIVNWSEAAKSEETSAVDDREICLSRGLVFVSNNSIDGSCLKEVLFYWLLVPLLKIHAGTFEVNMTNSQFSTKRWFQWQQTAPPHKYIIYKNKLYCAIRIKKKNFPFFVPAYFVIALSHVVVTLAFCNKVTVAFCYSVVFCYLWYFVIKCDSEPNMKP